MTLKIDDDTITSPDTWHAAVRINHVQWRVTWLPPDRRLTRNQAITAMMIAATVGASDDITEDPIYPHVNSWAHELGLEGKGAAGAAARPCRWEPKGVFRPVNIGALEDLRYHWGTAYTINYAHNWWTAKRKDGRGHVLAESSPEALKLRIRADYEAMPVPRDLR